MLIVKIKPITNSMQTKLIMDEISKYFSELQKLYYSQPLAVRTSVVAAGAAGAYVILKCAQTVFDRHVKGYPSGPIAWIPWIGSAVKLYNYHFLINVCGLYGAITYLHGLGVRTVVINESRIAKNVIFNQKRFAPRIQFADSTVPVMAPCGGTSQEDQQFSMVNGPAWKSRRQYAMSVLVRHCDSRMMSDMMHEVMHTTVFPELDGISGTSGTTWNPNRIMSYIAFNTVYHANFGKSADIDDPECLALREAMRERFALVGATRPMFLFPSFMSIWKKLSVWGKIEEVHKKQKSFFTKILSERRQYYKIHPKELEKLKSCVEGKTSSAFNACYVDYLMYLLDYSKTAGLNEYQVMNDLFIMFGAGTDTTSMSLEYIIYLLMKRPDIQETVCKDLKRVIKESQGNNEVSWRSKFSVGVFLQSVLFKAFVYECLRVVTVGPRGVSHICWKDEKVAWTDEDGVKHECVIPARSSIVTNMAYMHLGDSTKEAWKNKELGLKMDDLCLDNWMTTENDEMKFVMNRSFINFGSGSRDCVGQQLAMKEIYLVIGYLILNYKFEAKNGDTTFTIDRKDGFTISVTNDIPVFVSRRD